MSDITLENELASTLEWVRTAVESSTNFIADQAPLYVQELLAYGMWSSGLLFAIGLLFALVIVRVMKVLYKKSELIKNDDDEAGVYFVVTVIGGVLLLIASAVMLYQIMDIIKIQAAPRVYILEHLPRINL